MRNDSSGVTRSSTSRSRRPRSIARAMRPAKSSTRARSSAPSTSLDSVRRASAPRACVSGPAGDADRRPGGDSAENRALFRPLRLSPSPGRFGELPSRRLAHCFLGLLIGAPSLCWLRTSARAIAARFSGLPSSMMSTTHQSALSRPPSSATRWIALRYSSDEARIWPASRTRSSRRFHSSCEPSRRAQPSAAVHAPRPPASARRCR